MSYISVLNYVNGVKIWHLRHKLPTATKIFQFMRLTEDITVTHQVQAQLRLLSFVELYTSAT